MPSISHDFGQNGDEDVEAQYGQDIFNYYARGDQQALDYDTHLHPVFSTNISGMQFYGGMFNLMTESVHQIFPSWQIMDVRHFFAALLGALLMIFTGLLAYRVSNKKWWIAVLGLGFMIFSPRIFGESMNNGKDIPFATGMVIAIYYFVRLMQDLGLPGKSSWKTTMGIALGIFITFGMRPAGGLLLIAYLGLYLLVYIFFNKEIKSALWGNKYSLLKRTILQLITAFLIGYGLALFTWPYGLVSPIKHLFSSLAEMANRSIIIMTLYDGITYPSHRTPWHYNFKWILITTPLIIVLFLGLFLVLFPKANKSYGSTTIFILLFAAVFPLLYIIIKQSPNFDSWRHIFFVYPYWVVMAALGVDMATKFFREKLKWVPLAAAGLGLLPAMAWTVRSHPFQYVYFNQFVGGLPGAFGKYDIDYYQVTNKKMMNWVSDNVPKSKDGKKIIVRSNLDGLDTYLQKDSTWMTASYGRFYERNEQDWDYFITYGRFISPYQLQNGKWPPANVVYSVKIDGVPLGVVIKRGSKDDSIAYQALNNENFETAILKYESYLKTDSTDEMVYFNYGLALASVDSFGNAIHSLKKAILLDASRPEFFQLLAILYKEQGDMEQAQNAYIQYENMVAEEDNRMK